MGPWWGEGWGNDQHAQAGFAESLNCNKVALT